MITLILGAIWFFNLWYVPGWIVALVMVCEFLYHTEQNKKALAANRKRNNCRVQ